MGALGEYSDLVSAIYDAAIDFDRWPIALERLCDARQRVFEKTQTRRQAELVGLISETLSAIASDSLGA